LHPLRQFGRPVAGMMARMPYTALQQMFDPSAPAGLRNYWKSAFLDVPSDQAMEVLARYARTRPSPFMQIHLHALGGAMGRLAPDATAFAHREAPFVYNIVGMWPDSAGDADSIAWVREFYEAMRPYGLGAYINFMGEGEDARVASAYGANYARLVSIKDKYDPDNLFRLNQNIRPSMREAA
jgi:FAD/FMN-containing dehydrogenase